MAEKKKILFTGISMNCGGTEKAFLSLLSSLDKDKYDIDLLLAKKEGLFLDFVPENVNVIGPQEYGDMFLLSSKNAAKTILSCMAKRNPLVLFEVAPYFLKILLVPAKRSFTATRMWCRLLRHFKPFEKEFGSKKHYDAAVAFWGDRTMFYMCDKVNADKKIAWLHFDYCHPPRDDKLYLSYFEKCDYIVNVSSSCHDDFVKKFPELEKKCVMIENIDSPEQINLSASIGETFPDALFTGRRLLSIMRICDQKGYDFIPPILRKLKDDGYNIKWYIVGGGLDSDIEKLKESATSLGVSEMLDLLGPKSNPYAYLRDCDIFVLPSRFEGKPITVEEAKIMRKPIVASNYLSAHEQLCDGKYGLICDIGVDGTYSAIKRMLDEPGLAKSFSDELAKHDFSNVDEVRKFDMMIE